MSYEYGVVKIQLRRDTAANFASANTLLASGEPAYAIDTAVLKIGDGRNGWNSLSGIAGGGGGSGAEVNDLSTAVTWVVVPTGYISEASVTQHSGALTITESQIVDLGNYLASGNNVSLLINDANYVGSGSNVSLLVNDANYAASGDNVSVFVNDANYVASGDNLSNLNNDSNYISSDNTYNNPTWLASIDASILSGSIPADNLPSYVDDILEYNGTGNFPAIGSTGLIYVDTSSNNTYRWGGSVYVELTDDTAVWGNIGGTLSDQTDVYNAITARAASGDNVSIFVNDSGYLTDLINDTSPQLGGGLDTRGNEIFCPITADLSISNANGDLILWPGYWNDLPGYSGTGNLIIKGMGYTASSGSMVLGEGTSGTGPNLNREGVGIHIAATGTSYAQLKLSNEDPSTTYAASGAELSLEYGLLQLNNMTRWGDIQINSVNSSNQKFERAYFGSSNINIGTESYIVPVRIWTDTATIHGNLDVNGNINGSGFIKDGGTSAQFLKADGSVDSNTYLANVEGDGTPLLGGSLNLDNHSLVIDCRNDTFINMTAGTPVYITGYYSSNNKPLIAVADASDVNKMPAFGVLDQDLNSGQEGTLSILGVVSNIDTSGLSVGSTVYVASGGGFTTTKPDGNEVLIQNIGKVLLDDSTSGRMLVLGAGRSNDVPNSGNFNVLTVDGNVSATGFIATSTANTGFLKSDGSVDINTYVDQSTFNGWNKYDIAYWSNDAANQISASLSPRFVISGGKMGVAKSSPSYVLDVGGSGNFDNNVRALGFMTPTGTSSQFLKADGSVDSTSYLTGISNIDITNFNTGTIVLESEGISSNDNDTTLPTSAAVKDYVDANAGSPSGVTSDTGLAGGGSVIANIVTITSGDYASLATPHASTLYFVTG